MEKKLKKELKYFTIRMNIEIPQIILKCFNSKASGRNLRCFSVFVFNFDSTVF